METQGSNVYISLHSHIFINLYCLCDTTYINSGRLLVLYFLTIRKTWYGADIKVEFTPFGAHAVAVCVSVTCSWSPVVCFEDDSRMLTVMEEDGKACVNVTRSMGDPDTFGYRAVDVRVGTRATGTHS